MNLLQQEQFMSRQQKSSNEKSKPTAEGSGGKLANDSNKVGDQEPTQVNEGQRTPESRHDRQTTAGTTNQVKSRRAIGSGGGVGGWH
jgi:hypothetical protein